MCHISLLKNAIKLKKMDTFFYPTLLNVVIAQLCLLKLRIFSCQNNEALIALDISLILIGVN